MKIPYSMPYRYVMVKGKDCEEHIGASYSLCFADNGQYITTYYNRKAAESVKDRFNKILRECAIDHDVKIVRSSNNYIIVEGGFIISRHSTIVDALRAISGCYENFSKRSIRRDRWVKKVVDRPNT